MTRPGVPAAWGALVLLAAFGAAAAVLDRGGHALETAIVLLTTAKAWIVIAAFMEAEALPPLPRRLLFGWLAAVSLLLLGAVWW